MVLDVILPTFNREALLKRALDSLRAARLREGRPDSPGLEVRVLVVDNASTDGTRALVQREADRFAGRRLHYLFVPTPGKPHALNAGIAATDGDLIGLIDDDEEVDAGWFESISRHFGHGADVVDFIGGKCLPLWGAPRPEWLGRGYLGVIGWVDPGDKATAMDESYPGILMGGNAVIRRSVLERAGTYSVALNRSGAALLGCEDEDMYHRLLAHGARGRYAPDLVIYHHVPEARLTRRYFRRWCFWRGVSLGVMDRNRRAPVPYLAGIPRYQIGRAARALARYAGDALKFTPIHDPAERFECELACWDVAGLLWGKHFHRAPEQRVAESVRGSEPAMDRERHA